MEEKELKTSLKQRIVIAVIAIIMVGSIIASYVAIVAGGSNNTSVAEPEIDEAKIAQYSEEYAEKLEEFKKISEKDFKKFSTYRSEIKAYNESSANTIGNVQTRDLLKGTGRKIAEDDVDYLAYYVGWCADETIFDSSFDNNEKPKAFDKVLDVSLGMIEGWTIGVTGMRIGGVREVTIPGELAYGSSMEICGGYNKPLRFLVMAVENKDPLKTAAEELDLAYMKLQYAYYGIDYEDVYGK